MLSLQVGRLLQSLHIDPMTLPGQSEGSSWDNIFQNGAARRDGQGMLDVTLQNRIQNSGWPAAEDRQAHTLVGSSALFCDCSRLGLGEVPYS